MFRSFKCSWLILLGLGLGLVAGLMIGGVWPDTPLHAVSTDRSDDAYIMATGPIDDETEGVFILDCLTGELGMALMNPVGKFLGNRAGVFSTPLAVRSVLPDFNVDPSKNPRFMMVTGLARTQRSTGTHQRSRSMAYVMEITTGKVIAYAFHWTGTVTRGLAGTIVPLDGVLLRAPTGGAGGGDAAPAPRPRR